jgi:hypothetical protein
MPAANYSTPPPSGTNLSTALPLLAAALGGNHSANGGSTSDLSSIVNALKKLFGGGAPNTGFTGPTQGQDPSLVPTTMGGGPFPGLGDPTAPDPFAPTPNVTTNETLGSWPEPPGTSGAGNPPGQGDVSGYSAGPF